MTRGTPAQVASAMTDVVYGTFVSGMTAAFLVAAVVALAGAGIALLVRQGRPVEGGAGAVAI